MTRRVTIAILLTVWATLIAGGVLAYAVTRTILLEDLDSSLKSRAASLPELEGAAGPRSRPPLDRFTITREGPTPKSLPATFPATHQTIVTNLNILDAWFEPAADGTRLRTITLRARTAPFGSRRGYSLLVKYSGSAEHFDTILYRLAATLALFGAAGGLAGALIAAIVSRRALRPLKHAADAIGEIDERNLDRRIDAGALPVELVPMASRLNQLLTRLEYAFAQRRRSETTPESAPQAAEPTPKINEKSPSSSQN